MSTNPDATDQPADRAFGVDGLRVASYAERAAAGRAAARAIATDLRTAVAASGSARIAFAAAPSQEDMLAALVAEPDVPWARVTAFHLDDYIGLPARHPALFAEFLRRHVFDHVSLGTIHLMDTTADADAECARYAALLAEAPLDVVALGIGENGHLAFNDPPIADFSDPAAVKAVELDETSRRQQVNDGCFATLEEVPRTALTLTLSTLLSARALRCVVPGERKRGAVRDALYGPITTACPASGLRRHPDASLYLDAAATP